MLPHGPFPSWAPEAFRTPPHALPHQQRISGAVSPLLLLFSPRYPFDIFLSPYKAQISVGRGCRDDSVALSVAARWYAAATSKHTVVVFWWLKNNYVNAENKLYTSYPLTYKENNSFFWTLLIIKTYKGKSSISIILLFRGLEILFFKFFFILSLWIFLSWIRWFIS